MSHIVTIQTQVRDPAAIQAACQRLGLPAAVHQTARLFTTTATGYAVQLPAWRYPVVCDTQQGQLHYDNYQGRWGQPKELDRFLQGYAVEKAKLEARRRGHTVAEQQLADGSVRLTVQMAGGAS